MRQPRPRRARAQPNAQENKAPSAWPDVSDAPGAAAQSEAQAAGCAAQHVQQSPGAGLAWHSGRDGLPLSPLLKRQGCSAQMPVRTQAAEDLRRFLCALHDFLGYCLNVKGAF